MHPSDVMSTTVLLVALQQPRPHATTAHTRMDIDVEMGRMRDGDMPHLWVNMCVRLILAKCSLHYAALSLAPVGRQEGAPMHYARKPVSTIIGAECRGI